MPTPYYRRRELTLSEQLPAVGAAVGAAVGVGLAVFYVTRVLLQRTPLVDPAVPPPADTVGGADPSAPALRARSLVR